MKTYLKIAICALSFAAFTAAEAYQGQIWFLTGQYQGQSIGGQTGTVCVYQSMGKTAHVFIGIGICPISITE